MINRLSAAIVPLCIVLATAAAGPVEAQTAPPPTPPPEASSDVGNWGFLPFSAPEVVVLRPEDRSAMRKLEDKQLQETRAIEDRFAADLRALRVKHAQERESLLRTFRR
jgi:hypothetical protein